MPGRDRQQPTDDSWMMKALALAEKGEGRTRPNPPVGAIVVAGAEAVGMGFHRKAGAPHAEVIALQEAGERARGGTLYVTLEPCSTQGRTPPCTGAIIASGIKRVVTAVRDPNPMHTGRGIRKLRRAGIQTGVGTCKARALCLIAPFSKWIRTGRPYVTLKMGTTLDGRIGDMKGRSRWITGSESRRLVQNLRRKADAVMVGCGTACADNPSLLPRPAGAWNGYRIIVDSTGRTPPGARVLNDGHVERTIIAVASRCPQSRRAVYERKGAIVWVLPPARGRASLRSLMTRLGKMGLLQILCEGGGVLASSMVEADVVDEFLFLVAPRFLGASGVPAIGGPGWSLKAAPELDFRQVERVGEDILIRATRAGKA